MIPMSNSSNLDRRRHAHSQRQGLVRSNSSLLGSIKNFVAAPFSRLFTGSANEFDDPNDISGKRRLIVNTEVDNNDIVEDGPAPAKRMRVRSPEPESPPRSAGYLDPPGSAFQLGNHNNLSNNPPSRSASISVPSTVPDPSAYNARSTISPLRNHFSRNMSIDSIPSHQPRPLSRDITMKSLSSIPGDRSVSIRAGSRDSLPPPFRLRDSLTPQPHKSMVRQPNRDVSEPPPMTALHSKPVFVRGPSQVLETPQPSQSVATLGSLVDSQRSLRSPSRQRTLLFGPSQPPVDSQAAAAERTLHELEFYKTPLVPTRIRSRMPNSVAASASSSNITDMFARKHSLILMGDHDRPSRGSKRDKKKKGKGKEGKESNETKPYAGTTGIRKRLAKAKDINEKSTSQEATVVEKVNDSPPTARGDALPEIPVPPPKEKDIFNVVPFPSASTPAHQSSLRVGRAARSHLSRPIKKFSATYDDDEDKVTDETKKDLEMLEEAAKKVPVFEIPAGFTFAKEVPPPPTEPIPTSANEPPISTLPFSLTKPAASVEAPSVQAPSFAGPFPDIASSDALSTPSRPTASAIPPSVSAETPDTAGKVPNFFASSKVLASHSPSPTATPPMPTLVAPSVPLLSDASSTFSFAPDFGSEKEVSKSTLSIPSASSNASPSFSFDGQSVAQPSSSASMPPTTEAVENRKDESQSSSFSFGTSSAAPQPAPFSFGKPSEVTQPVPAASSSTSFSFGPSAGAADSAAKSSFSFGTPSSGSTPSSNPFSSTHEGGKPTGSILFGASVESSKPIGSSLFGETSSTAKPAGSSMFNFGQPSTGDASENVPKPLFGSHSSKTEGLNPSFADGNGGSLNSPFSFAPPTPGTPDPPKSLFGAPTSASDSNKPAGFTFGGSSSAPPTSAGSSSFSFGNPVGNLTSAPTSFSFGVTSARPVTPPAQDQEVRMEESPTRDIQTKPVEPRPSLNGFSFNSAPATSATSLFGQSSAAPASTGFTFGQSAGSSNPFGTMKTDDKSAESKPFGLGPQAGSSPFTFGRTEENDPPRPSTTGSFSFGASSTSNTGPGPTFSFGAPSNNTASSNPFGATSSSSTLNNSSTFGQPAPSFSLGATSAATSGGGNPFVFGSQPASPATPSAGLPSSGFGPATTNPFGTQVSSNAGFGSSVPSSGSSLFTIGAAPSDSGRQIKKLPSRKKR